MEDKVEEEMEMEEEEQRVVRGEGEGGRRESKRGDVGETVAKALHGQRFPMPPFWFLRC